MLFKVILVVVVICFALCEAQNEVKRGDQNIGTQNDEYEYFDQLDNGPIRGDLEENASKVNNMNQNRKKRNSETLRGDQGPPLEDLDDYSNVIDEEPVRGDLGAQITDERIVGGVSVGIASFPHIVAILTVTEFNLIEHLCGGSILSPNIIVTAAHCPRHAKFMNRKMLVRAGSTSSKSGGIMYEVKESIIHEGYTEGYNNDIAILILAKKIRLSPNARKIPIAIRQLPVGSMCAVAGWGVTDENVRESSANLNFVDVPIIDHEECKNIYADIGKKVTENMLCAGYEFGMYDSCHADSGGPLTYEGYLVGIVSWGQGCGRANNPGVYVDVYYFRDWINEQLAKYSI